MVSSVETFFVAYFTPTVTSMRSALAQDATFAWLLAPPRWEWLHETADQQPVVVDRSKSNQLQELRAAAALRRRQQSEQSRAFLRSPEGFDFDAVSLTS